MKLVGSKTSPYVRKVRVILEERKLEFDFVEASAWTPDTQVPQYNPLNKVPVLVLDDGSRIFDSGVISEYLDAISGGHYIPAEPLARAKARTMEALGDGIADAGITFFLERKRDPERQDPAWMKRQMDKVDAGIIALAAALGPRGFLGGAQPNIGDIACACALFWAEYRMPEIPWREENPALKAWAQRMESRPAFQDTRPG